MMENSSSLDFSAGLPEQDGYSLAKIQVAPLIDTVLFLIWFYLMVGQLVMHQKDATIELPHMNNPSALAEKPAEIVVNLRSDDKITVEGMAYSSSQLLRRLQSEMEKARQQGQELHLVVRADRRQQFAQLEEVLKTCREAGLKQVALRAESGGSP